MRLAAWTRPFLMALLLGSTACPGSDSAENGANPAVGGLDHDRIAEVLLARLDLQPGERVLLVGLPGRFDPLVPRLREGFTAAGAVELGAWSVEGEAPADWRSDFTDGLVGLTDDDLVYALSAVDAAVMLPGATTTHPVYAAMQEVLRSGHGRTVHFHWSGAYRLDGSTRPIEPEVDAFYERALAETDYAALAQAQRAFEDAMRDATVRVTTPAGTDISLRIGERPVTKQDGDASAARAAHARNLIDREVELPAGAVRVAPIEESVSGRIVFPVSIWGSTRTEDLELVFERGKVVSSSASTGGTAAAIEMEGAGEAGKSFREFALGLNPEVAVPTEGDPWIPYYGYGAGVVRLSLGDNTELGGEVSGGYVRWNFFTDATVAIDGEVWVKDGRLVR
jgi:aminopeptidase